MTKTVNQHQVAAIGIALGMTLLCVALATLVLKQWWPSARLASFFCLWLAVGLIVLTLQGKLPKLPHGEKLDVHGGFIFVWLSSSWPVLMFKRA